MANFEVLFQDKIGTRQMGRVLPGPIYPRGEYVLPYTKNALYYVGHHKNSPVGSTVSAYINDINVGTTLIQDSEGTFIFKLPTNNIPRGNFILKFVFSDSSDIKHYYSSYNLYIFMAVFGNLFNESRIEALKTVGNLFYNSNDINCLGLRASGEAFAILGKTIGFIQPFDWTAKRYADVLGGNQALNIPGVLPTLRKGSTVGAIKDIVYSITGIMLSDDDFTLLQNREWRLSRDGVKYIFDSSAPNNVGTTGAEGPHYFINNDINSLATPLAIVRSGIQKANSILLNISTNGIFTDNPDIVSRGEGTTDKLFYTYLNPFAEPINIDKDYETLQDTVANGITLPSIYEQSSLCVYLNGAYIRDDLYTIDGSNKIILDPSLNAEPSDIIAATFVINGITRYTEKTEIAADYPGGAVISLTNPAIGTTIDVFLNSQLITSYTFDQSDPTILTITRALEAGDSITVRYASVASPVRRRLSFVYDSANPPDLNLAEDIIPESVQVFINGLLQIDGISATTNSIVIDYSGLEINDNDTIDIFYAPDIPYGYNVKIVDLNGFEYSQGIHFTVNYTKGEIIWNVPNGAPSTNEIYQVWYTYFEKDILDNLLGLVKPATAIIYLQFTTLEGETFRPYYFFGVPNPTGDVIF